MHDHWWREINIKTKESCCLSNCIRTYIMDAFVVDSSTQSLIFAVQSDPIAPLLSLIKLQLITAECRKRHRMDWSIAALPNEFLKVMILNLNATKYNFNNNTNMHFDRFHNFQIVCLQNKGHAHS